MKFFYQTVYVSRLVGVAPVTKKENDKKGWEFERSRRGLVVVLLQLVMVVWMVIHFRYYMSRKYYYSSLRIFQVTVLMYCEVGQSFGTFVCTLFIRSPKITEFLGRCTAVIRDLGGASTPLVVRYGWSVSLLIHTLTTLYRTKDSVHRTFLLIPFWVGMTQVVMVHVLLFAALTLVDMAYSSINRDILILLSRRPDKDQTVMVRSLQSLRQRNFRAGNLFDSCRTIFGPDVFMLCFFFLFKISFICYHIYYKQDARLWGQNTLVGELTGYLQITQLLLTTFFLGYVCDTVAQKSAETRKLLLNLIKKREEKVNSEIRNIVKAFILQIKSQSHTFSVCDHFVLSRVILYDMVLGAVTYVFILIQFQGIKSTK